MNFMEACKEVLMNNNKYTRGIVGIRKRNNNEGAIEFYNTADNIKLIIQGVMEIDLDSDWEIVEEKKTLSDKIFHKAEKGTLDVEFVKEHLKRFIDSFTGYKVGDLHRGVMYQKAKEIFGDDLI